MSLPCVRVQVAEASDRTQVEAKEVRLSDMPTITLDDTDVQTVLKMSYEHPSSRPMSLVGATPEGCIPLKANQFIEAPVCVYCFLMGASVSCSQEQHKGYRFI